MMSSFLTGISTTVFTWTAMTLMTSWIIAYGYPLFRKALKKDIIRASNAALLVLLYSLFPACSAILVLILLSHPELIEPFIAEHCHSNICEPHTLHFKLSTLMGLGFVSLTVCLLIFGVLSVCMQLFRKHQYFLALDHFSEIKPGSYHVIDNPNLFAWCVGLWRPKVYLSKGLLELLDENQLNIILAHEFSHVRRRDNLRRWILHWLTMVWPKAPRCMIRKDIKNYSEQACDLEAVIEGKVYDDLDSAVSLIEKHCLKTDNNSQQCAISHQQRLSSLRKELKAFHKKNIHWSKPFALYFVVGSLWATLLLSTVYASHPILEWLSQ